MSWQHEAACRDHHTDTFYPTSERHDRYEMAWKTRHALTICRQCPVTQQCLNVALTFDDPYGIWGATTPKDREALQRLRRRKQTA